MLLQENADDQRIFLAEFPQEVVTALEDQRIEELRAHRSVWQLP